MKVISFYIYLQISSQQYYHMFIRNQINKAISTTKQYSLKLKSKENLSLTLLVNIY